MDRKFDDSRTDDLLLQRLVGRLVVAEVSTRLVVDAVPLVLEAVVEEECHPSFASEAVEAYSAPAYRMNSWRRRYRENIGNSSR